MPHTRRLSSRSLAREVCPGAAHERGLSMATRIGECSATSLTTPSTLNPPRSSRSDRSSTSATSKPLRSAPTSTPSHSAIVLEASCGAEESERGVDLVAPQALK